MRSLPNLQRTLLSGAVILGLLVLPVLDAAAQIPKGDQNCINALNKAGWKLARAQAKHLQSCIRDYQRKGESADVCAPTDPKGRIERAQERTTRDFQRKCSALPGFGPQDPNQVNALAREKEFELYARVFGSSLDELTTDANDPLESRCIQLIAKSVAKCEDAKIKEFVKCKKAGLKDGADPIESASELQDRCLGTGTDQQPDPPGRIQKKCTDPDRGFIFKYMQKSCVEKSVDLVSAFGNGVCAAEAAIDGPTLATCIEREVECAFCLWANATDGLSRDCDLFDNAEADGTCPFCGNGYREGSEQCDGTDDVACNADPCLPNCTCGCDCCSTGLDLLSFETNIATGIAGQLSNYRCSNYLSGACAVDADCDFGNCFLAAGLCDVGFTAPCNSDADCQGSCNESVAGNLPLDLRRGSVYLGGGLNSVPLPVLVPDQGQYFSQVTACNSGTGELTLGPTTAVEVGERHCTSGRKCSTSGTTCVLDYDCPPAETCNTECIFGPPLPIPSLGTPATSVCVINHVAEDANGTAICDGGSYELDAKIRSTVYLTGDLFNSADPPDVPGVQPCPLCDTLCQGGSKKRFPCADDSDCPGGSCGGLAQCLGGLNDGEACSPETSRMDVHNCCMGGDYYAARCSEDSDCTSGGMCVSGCTSYPTSHDCPPDPWYDVTSNIGGVPVAFLLTTDSITMDAIDRPEGSRVFFGFCRDVRSIGSLCFEGDEYSGCPLASPRATGNAVPCNSDAECDVYQCLGGSNDGALCSDISECPGPYASCGKDAYESCVQRNPGGFSYAASTRIEVTGNSDGQCLADGEPHTSTLVSIFAMPSTFDPTVDASLDLPGPGAVLLAGETRLE